MLMPSHPEQRSFVLDHTIQVTWTYLSKSDRANLHVEL